MAARTATRKTAVKSAPAKQTATKPTPAARVDALEERLDRVTALLEKVVTGQHQTPAAVAKKVAKAEVDPVQALVADKGLSFAKGGRNYLTIETATAVARVLKTGKPEIVEAAPESSNERRNVTHEVLFRTEAGNVAIQPLYTPDPK